MLKRNKFPPTIKKKIFFFNLTFQTRKLFKLLTDI